MKNRNKEKINTLQNNKYVNIDKEIIILSRKKIQEDNKKGFSDTFTLVCDETNLFPNKDKTFIEFEIQNINSVYIDDSKNIKGVYINNSKDITESIYTKKMYCDKKISNNYETQQLGNFINTIMNNYDKYIELITKHFDMIHYAKMDWRNKSKLLKKKFKKDYLAKREKLDIELNNMCISILKRLLYQLNIITPELTMLENYIGQYIYEFYEKDYPNKIDELKQNIARLKERYPNISCNNANIKKYEKRATKRLYEDTRKLKSIDNISYKFKNIEKFFNILLNDFKYGKKLIEKSFIHNIENRNNKFSGITTLLPNAQIEYILDYNNQLKPYKYLYEIKSLADLFNVTIYQLTIHHKVVIQCKNCKKYIIPDRTDRVYCTDSCKGRYMTRQSKENESEIYGYYRKLYNRYKNNKTYKREFEEIKILYNKCIEDKLDDEEIVNILLEFEEKTKNAHTVKRGRPKKK